jgi:hypothetical protein
MPEARKPPRAYRSGEIGIWSGFGVGLGIAPRWNGWVVAVAAFDGLLARFALQTAPRLPSGKIRSERLRGWFGIAARWNGWVVA